MKHKSLVRGAGATFAVAAVATTLAFVSTPRAGAEDPPSDILAKDQYSLDSARDVDGAKQTAVLPLHRGVRNAETVWFIMTDASDMGIARDLNIMYAPKLANMAIGCAKCVQTVILEPVHKDNKFAEAVISFSGVPDFSPARIWQPGAKRFPPAKAQPGAVGESNYSIHTHCRLGRRVQCSDRCRQKRPVRCNSSYEYARPCRRHGYVPRS